jgi:hypothetical protein
MGRGYFDISAQASAEFADPVLNRQGAKDAKILELRTDIPAIRHRFLWDSLALFGSWR